MRHRFHPRGIGSNWLRCFRCGSTDGGPLEADGVHYRGRCQPDMAAVVDSHAEGLRVAALFVEQGLPVFLDWRPNEPQHVQVKLGACAAHLPCLERLLRLVQAADGWIDSGMIREARRLNEDEPDGNRSGAVVEETEHRRSAER